MRRFLVPLVLACLLLVAIGSPAQEKKGAAADGRAPVPAAADQIKAQNLVKEIFKDDFAKKTPMAMLALAAKLMEEAKLTKGDPAGRFALMREARELAVQGGDLTAALKIVDQLAIEFAVRAPLQKLEVLKLALPTATTTVANRKLAETALVVLDEPLFVDDFDTAVAVVKLASAAAEKSRTASLIQTVQNRSAEVDGQKKEFESVKLALKKLEETPNDADANLSVGEYLCLGKGDWVKGLPYLAKGKDEKLRKLAAKDLAAPVKASDQASLADEWWDHGDSQKGKVRTRLQERAAYWYTQAVPELTGLAKTKAEKRILSVGPVEASADKSVDLLKLIDPEKDHYKGEKWAFKGKALVSPADNIPKLQIPYTPPEEYDLRLIVERKLGNGQLGIGLLAGGRQVMVALDSYPQFGYICCLLLDETTIFEREKAHKGPVFKNENKVEIVCKVRKKLLRVLVDGKTVINFNGEYERVRIGSFYQPPNKQALFLSSYSSAFEITKIEMTPITGQGKVLKR